MSSSELKNIIEEARIERDISQRELAKCLWDDGTYRE